MPTYKIRILTPFMDAITNQSVPSGSIFETKDLQRTMKIINMGLGELIEIAHNKPGKRIMLHQKFCYKIGGIESANLQIARAFSDKNIVFVFMIPNLNHMLELGKTCDVIWDNGYQTFDVDVLIMTNYDSAPAIIDRVKAKKIYQQIHADFANLKKMSLWKDFYWKPHQRIDKILAVSETAKQGLETSFGLRSTVVPNVLVTVEKSKRPMVFLVLSRASAEKGIDRVREFIDRMDAAGKNFVVYICSTVSGIVKEDLEKNRHVVIVEPNINNYIMLGVADYLIQLSLNESYCYSVREALEEQVPCIVSRIPEFEKLIQDGKNGYILDDDLGNLDIEKIFSKVPKPKPYREEIPEIWNKVLEGEL